MGELLDIPDVALSESGSSPTRGRWRVANLPARLIVVLLGAVLLVVVVLPAAALLLGSFTSELRGGEVGAESYLRVFTERRLYNALLSTFWIAGWTTLLSLVVGVPLAWVIQRTNVPGRGFFKILVAIAFMMPAYQTAAAYLILGGRHAGLLNQAIVNLTPLEQGPLNVFSYWGIVLVSTINAFPYVTFLCAAALSSIDARLEESAQILGASRSAILWGITWKLITPAILGSTLLVFVKSMSMFGVHAFLGLPASIFTLPTLIYEMFLRFPPDYATAASLSMILVLVTVVFLFVQQRYLAKRSFVTVSGKTARPATSTLGRRSRLIVAAACHLYFTIAVYLPVGVLVWVAFNESRVDMSLAGLTLEHFTTVLFDVGLTKRALTNSFMLGVAAATIATLIAAFVAYMSLRSRRLRVLDYIAMIPLGIPGTALGVGLILAWIRIPLPVYASMFILLLAYLARGMPLGVRAADSSLRQLDNGLEDAARMSGATWLRSIWDITLPLVKGGLLAAWALTFVMSFQELGASILIYGPGGETISVAIYDRTSDGQLEQVAALSVIAMVVAAVVLVVMNRLSGGNVAKRVGVD